MKKRKFLNKALSLALSLAMVFSAIPTFTVDTALADSMGNMTSGSRGYTGNGAGNDAWYGYGSGPKYRHGFRLSVWFAPTVGQDENKNPIYGWDVGNGLDALGNVSSERQVGKTVHWKNCEIRYPDDAGADRPYFWSDQSVYSQMTKREHYQQKKEWGNNIFQYYITQNLTAYGWTQETLDGGNGEFPGINSIYNTYSQKLSEMANKGFSDTYGYRQLEDYLSRIYDMNKDGSGIRLTPENFIMPLSVAQVGYSEGKSGEYIKSYFLNPFVLNEISATTEGYWSWDDFILGQYGDDKKGEFKIFIEPESYRLFAGVPGVISWHDAIYDRDGKSNVPKIGGAGVIPSEASAISEVANALFLENEERTLIDDLSGYWLGQRGKIGAKYTLGSDEQANYEDTDNTLGLGVITSPSLNDYDPPEPENTPIIIKNYVKVTGVDKEGHVKFETVKEAVSEGAEFKVAHNEEDAKDLGVDNGAQSRVPSNLEDSESIMIDGTICTAYLNDIITVNRNVEMTSDMKWEGEVPESSTLQIEKSAKDIVGYKLGKRIYNVIDVKKFLQDVIERQNLSISIPADADQLDLEAIFQRILGDLTEAQRKAALEAYLIDYDVEAALNAAGVEVYETAEIVDESEIHIDTLTTVEGVGIEAQEYKTENDIRLGKTDENGKTVKYEDDELGAGVANPATLIARYVVVPNARQYNVIEVVNKDTGETHYYKGKEYDISYEDINQVTE